MAAQLLLFAEPLLCDGLSQLLISADQDYQVVSQADALRGAPQLVIWHLGNAPDFDVLAREVILLQQRWQPTPLLLLLPEGQPHSTANLLQLPVAGLLEAPTPAQLLETIATLLAGGRVVALASAPGGQPPEPSASGSVGMQEGLGQRLLWSGIQQIDAEMVVCLRQLQTSPITLLNQWITEGRLRELKAARHCLTLLWGPIPLPTGPRSALGRPPGIAQMGTQLSLPQPTA
ncbi:MAG: DUF3685 domain-containing protein, partial [Synechococcaceae bacterium WB9_2_170]|nr:DUF3685 domain-containing protein [Synechococcaceae bacterium WB9_2_170]